MTKCNRFPTRSWLLPVALLLFATLSVLAAGESAAAVPSTPKIFQWRPFLAPFHAVVLHYPIGFITMAFLLEIYGMRQPSLEVKRITRFVIWISLISGIVAATFGILRAAGGGYEHRAVETHRWTGLGVVACTLATLALQKFTCRDNARRAWTYAYRSLLTVTLGLLVVAGHMGGNLTHGSKYLTENAPTFVRELLTDEPMEKTEETPAANLDEGQRFFVEQVQPILNAKCVRCHGSEKQKGGYRLDQPEMALKGGESEKPSIKPGNPLESRLAQLILLPPGHDDIMPPEGKEPLTPEEIGVVLHWIRIGAPFGATPPPSATDP